MKQILGDGHYDGDKWKYQTSQLFHNEDVFDLSKEKWTFGTGKDILERYLATKLFGCLPSVIEYISDGEPDETLRWNRERRASKYKIVTPPSDEEQELFTSTKPWNDYANALKIKFNGLEPTDMFVKG